MRGLAVACWLVSGCSFPGMAQPGGDGADGDASTSGDGRPPPPMGPCGKPGVLADDFADGVAAPVWVVIHPAQVVEQAGTLAVSPIPATADLGTGYSSNPTVDLRDAAVEVEVVTMVASGTGATGYLTLSSATGSVGLYQIDGQLVGRGATQTAVAYDPVAHRHWRIEEAGGQVTLQTSSDGQAWTPLHTEAAPAWIGSSRLTLGASNPGAAASPGTITFANLSTWVPSAVWCKLDALTDPFDDGVIGPQWAHHGTSAMWCLEWETSSAARADQYAGGACDAYHGSSALYDLRDTTLDMRIGNISIFTDGWITYAGVWDLTGRYIRLFFSNGQMCGDATSISPVCAPYVNTHDQWRLRETAGTLFWETADALAGPWRVVHSAPVPFDVSAVRPYFGTRTDRNIFQTINLNFDQFN